MVRFTTTIKKFGSQGEKTGWTYIEIPEEQAARLQPESKKSFRVKGSLDQYAIRQASLLPMGGGDFILPLNAAMRRALGKKKGDTIQVCMEPDLNEPAPPAVLLECLEDEPKAREAFESLSKSHRNYFSNWIRAAKTEPTKAKRIAAVINALEKGWNFGQMVRAMKADRNAGI